MVLWDGAIVRTQGIVTARHDNKSAHTVAIYERGMLNAPALRTMSEQIIRQRPRRRPAQAQA